MKQTIIIDLSGLDGLDRFMKMMTAINLNPKVISPIHPCSMNVNSDGYLISRCSVVLGCKMAIPFSNIWLEYVYTIFTGPHTDVLTRVDVEEVERCLGKHALDLSDMEDLI